LDAIRYDIDSVHADDDYLSCVKYFPNAKIMRVKLSYTMKVEPEDDDEMIGFDD
jgi:hypothetical protein